MLRGVDQPLTKIETIVVPLLPNDKAVGWVLRSISTHYSIKKRKALVTAPLLAREHPRSMTVYIVQSENFLAGVQGGQYKSIAD